MCGYIQHNGMASISSDLWCYLCQEWFGHHYTFHWTVSKGSEVCLSLRAYVFLCVHMCMCVEKTERETEKCCIY